MTLLDAMCKRLSQKFGPLSPPRKKKILFTEYWTHFFRTSSDKLHWKLVYEECKKEIPWNAMIRIWECLWCAKKLAQKFAPPSHPKVSHMDKIMGKLESPSTWGQQKITTHRILRLMVMVWPRGLDWAGHSRGLCVLCSPNQLLAKITTRVLRVSCECWCVNGMEKFFPDRVTTIPRKKQKAEMIACSASIGNMPTNWMVNSRKWQIYFKPKLIWMRVAPMKLNRLMRDLKNPDFRKRLEQFKHRV